MKSIVHNSSLVDMLKQDKSIKSSTDSVRLEELSISYECLASIGNSF